MRDSMRSIIATMAIMSLMTPTGPDHQIGPGERKSPARGQRLKVEPTEHTRSKKKSTSLAKLLRK
jgi:hypothetical protein